MINLPQINCLISLKQLAELAELISQIDTKKTTPAAIGLINHAHEKIAEIAGDQAYLIYGDDEPLNIQELMKDVA